MPRPRCRRPAPVGGFALPLAVMLLVAVSLVAALLLEAALAALRTGAAELGQARAEAAAESAVASALALRIDSSALALPPGALLATVAPLAPGAVGATVQKLASPFARIVVSSSLSDGRFRVYVGRLAIVVMTPDSAVAGELWLRPARGPWVVSVP